MDKDTLYRAITAYCKKYAIPINHLVSILEEDKVVPMIRGKGQEFSVFDTLRSLLPEDEWKVEKLNINPQPGQTDSDIVITHLPDGITIDVESKHAVRNSFSAGTRTTKAPHFKVKCHKSRSHKGRTETNDRYFEDDFDLLVTTPFNAFLRPGCFTLTDKEGASEFLKETYGITYLDADVLVNDIWVVQVTEISEPDKTLPRTPLVLFENDPHWKRLTAESLKDVLSKILHAKRALMQRGKVRPARESDMNEAVKPLLVERCDLGLWLLRRLAF